ncbi:MAG: hypothetical protein WKF58_20420 [Ilumatobacteraceae bacterium]
MAQARRHATMLAEFGVELSYVVEVVDSETGVARSTDGRTGLIRGPASITALVNRTPWLT